MQNKFTEEDRQKIIEFLNFIATNATFSVKTSDVIKYYGLLSHMQKTILPKVQDNILEIIKVAEAELKED